MKRPSLLRSRLVSYTALALIAAAFPQSARAQATLTTLYTFSGGSDGANPQHAGLFQGSDGNFYGTTVHGGTGSDGSVFKLTAAGALTTLYSFSGGSNGRLPDSGLIQGSDGNFYGTAALGQGLPNEGTVFKLTAAGAQTTLYSFSGGTNGSGDGGFVNAGLVQASDGNFYGATVGGGNPSGSGTIFKITTAGALTTLYSFSGSDGRAPYTRLIQGSDGNFYGTTTEGGTGGGGTVFKITAAGTLTTLSSFSNGAGLYAGLIQGSDGNFYGTTTFGGTNNKGTLFKLTAAGALTTLYTFSGGSDGAFPVAALFQGSDGNFYGTTEQGGTNNNGTVFKLTAAGALTTLYTFSGGSDGANPDAGLIQGNDGNFYGTTNFGGTVGGASGAGTIFRLTASQTPTPTPRRLLKNPGFYRRREI